MLLAHFCFRDQVTMASEYMHGTHRTCQWVKTALALAKGGEEGWDPVEFTKSVQTCWDDLGSHYLKKRGDQLLSQQST